MPACLFGVPVHSLSVSRLAGATLLVLVVAVIRSWSLKAVAETGISGAAGC